MRAAFHPGKEKEKWNPTAGTRLVFRADAVEDARKIEQQIHWSGVQSRRIVAVFRRRGHEVFAADERADGVNGARLVLKKRAGNALVEVVESQLLGGFSFDQPILIDQAVDEACLGKLEESLMEAAGEFLLAGFGEGMNPCAECLGLKDAERHHLAAACAAASLAGDLEARFAQLRGNAADERVIERLQDRQDLSEVGLAGRNDRSGCELSIANAHCEFNRDILVRLLTHKPTIVAKFVACTNRKISQSLRSVLDEKSHSDVRVPMQFYRMFCVTAPVICFTL